MTLDQLKTTNIPAMWSRLTPEQQAQIGMAALAKEFAGLELLPFGLSRLR